MSFHNSATCKRKAQARMDTIIHPYRELFGESLPFQKQYWTLAGPLYDDKGRLGTKSEFWQMSREGLLFARQYHGIDNSEEIINKNKSVAPAANFYHGDFVTQLQLASEGEDFNPGIIHADYTKLLETSIIDTSNIIYLIDKANIRDIMIVMNFPWNNPYAGAFHGEIDPMDVIKAFGQNQRFNSVWNDSWKIYPECYSYGGTGTRSKTTMATFIIYRK